MNSPNTSLIQAQDPDVVIMYINLTDLYKYYFDDIITISLSHLIKIEFYHHLPTNSYFRPQYITYFMKDLAEFDYINRVIYSASSHLNHTFIMRYISYHFNSKVKYIPRLPSKDVNNYYYYFQVSKNKESDSDIDYLGMKSIKHKKSRKYNTIKSRKYKTIKCKNTRL